MYQLDAVQVDTPPVMDGLVLEDSAWGTATPATGFVQSTPNEGESASEKTEVRVVFTADVHGWGVDRWIWFRASRRGTGGRAR